MPKRSLNPRDHDANKIEQLNHAVDALLARSDGKPPKVEASVEPLLRIAAELRHLPREQFKTRLKSALLEGRKTMSTVAEPITKVRPAAVPRLTFKDAAQAIEFYKSAFGAQETMRFEAGGKIAHAEISIGSSVVMLAEEWPEGGRFSPETLGNSPVMMALNVSDVDDFVSHAMDAGAKVVIPITDHFYGRREGTLQDPFGYLWSVSTVKEEMSVEEMYRRMDAMMKGNTASEKPAVNPIARGFRTVTPYLIASDGPGLLEFVKQAFRAEETFRTVGSAGGLHAEARIGDSMLMIAGGIPGREFRSTPNSHALHMYVEDADAVYQKALAAAAIPPSSA